MANAKRLKILKIIILAANVGILAIQTATHALPYISELIVKGISSCLWL